MYLKKRFNLHRYRGIIGAALAALIVFFLFQVFQLLTSGGIRNRLIRELHRREQIIDRTNILKYKKELYAILTECNTLLTIDASKAELYLIKARICYQLHAIETDAKKRIGIVEKIILNYRRTMAFDASLLDGKDYTRLTEMYFLLGPIYYFQVVKYGREAMNLNEYGFNLRKMYAIALVKTNEYEQGLTELKKLRKSTDIEIKFYTAICFKHLGKYDQAETIFQEIIRQSANIELIQASYNNIAWMAYSKGLYQLSIQLYQKALTFAKAYNISKDISEIYFWQSKIYYKLKNWYMGNHYRKLAQKIDPSNRFLQAKRDILRQKKENQLKRM